MLLQGHSAKPPPPQEFTSYPIRAPSGLLHPHWAMSVVKSSADGLGPSTVSLFYDISSSKASSVATCAKWTGTMDATLPFLKKAAGRTSILISACSLLLEERSQRAFQAGLLPESLSLEL